MNALVGAVRGTSWRALVPGALLLAVVLLLFRDTAAAMVAIWSRSETFAHAFLVPPIAVWLIWRQRGRLVGLPVRPAPLALLGALAAGVLWLLGELASVGAASQFALVALVVLVVPITYGWAVTRALLFPLLFLFFAVPVGEVLVPQLIDWTADFTVAALRLTGIPVYREGNQFVIPTGTWNVVEACSGVRYLIASVMVGALFAYLNYRSPRRRALFMVVAVAVPVVANWLRAYLIVLLGHLSGNTIAVGVDHLIYGWIFFGVVIMLMFMIGARWAEHDDIAGVARSAAQRPTVHVMGVRWGLLAMAAVVLALPHWMIWQLGHGPSSAVRALSLPESLPGGWHRAEAAPADWTPGFLNPNATTEAAYRQGERVVGTWIGYYRGQGDDRKLVSSTNLLASQDSGWAVVVSETVTVGVPGGSVAFRAAEVRGSKSPNALHAPRLRAWQIYWVGGQFTASDARAKVHQALDRLLGRGDDGAVVVLYTTLDDASRADATLAAFAADALGPIGEELARIRSLR